MSADFKVSLKKIDGLIRRIRQATEELKAYNEARKIIHKQIEEMYIWN